MKVIKLSQKQKKMLPLDLLVALELKSDNQVFPSRLCVSKEDAKRMLNGIRALARKQYPYAVKRVIDGTVGMHWLNYGPNTSLETAIKPGYAIILDE